jgi:hypothetical protein
VNKKEVLTGSRCVVDLVKMKLLQQLFGKADDEAVSNPGSPRTDRNGLFRKCHTAGVCGYNAVTDGTRWIK